VRCARHTIAVKHIAGDKATLHTGKADLRTGNAMSTGKPTRRDVLKTSVSAGAFMTLAPGAIAQAGQPVPPISMLYFGNWPEVVEFFRRRRKICARSV